MNNISHVKIVRVIPLGFFFFEGRSILVKERERKEERRKENKGQ